MMFSIRVNVMLLVALVACAPAAAQPAPPALVAWTAKPDPAPEPIAYAEDVRLTLPAKALGERLFIATPDRGARFLGVALTKPEQTLSWTLIDLQTGKSSPAMDGKMWLDGETILSPDGQYLAGTGVDFPTGTSFQVWSLKEKKQLVNLKGDATSDTPDLALTFLDPAQLLVYSNNLSTAKLQVLDVTTGKTLRTIELSERVAGSEKIFAVSPGGKYYVVTMHFPPPQGDGILIVDLQTGKSAGQSQVPKHGRFHNAGVPQALAFSHDGREIAALYQSGPRNVLIIWDAATGKVTADFPNISFEKHGFDDRFGKLMEFQPDGKRLRISHFLIDRQSGETVESIPPPPGDSGTIPMSMMPGNDAALTISEQTVTRLRVRFATVQVGR